MVNAFNYEVGTVIISSLYLRRLKVRGIHVVEQGKNSKALEESRPIRWKKPKSLNHCVEGGHPNSCIKWLYEKEMCLLY